MAFRPFIYIQRFCPFNNLFPAPLGRIFDASHLGAKIIGSGLKNHLAGQGAVPPAKNTSVSMVWTKSSTRFAIRSRISRG